MGNSVVFSKSDNADIRRVVYVPKYDAEVEYLQSSGTQYIDTGIIPNSEHKYEVTVSKTADNTAEVVPLGSWNAWQNAMFGSDIKNSTVGIYLLWGGGSHQTNIITNDWITLYGEKGLSKATLISTGEVLASRNFAGNFACNQSAYLFALNRNGSVVYRGSCKISRAKIWNGDTLVRDFIPVRVGSVGYMYDKISGQLFGNAGTGNFVLGQDVAKPIVKRCIVPSGLEEGVDYQRYNWLKGDGTAVINTKLYIEDYRTVTLLVRVKDFIKYSAASYLVAAGAVTGSGYGFSFSVARSRASSQYRITIADNSVTTLCSLDGIHTLEIRDSKIYADDVVKSGSFEYLPLSGRKLGLFGNTSGSTQKSNGYISNFNIQSSVGNLNFTPCQLLRPIPARFDANGIARQQGECGMIDLISGKFYGNVASSGSFTVENDND